MAMTRRMRLVWKVLLAFFIACTVASMAAWAFLLTTLCSNPRTPMPEAKHVIAYSCHGMTVFISPLQQAMRDWLIPAEMVFLFLSLITAAIVFLGSTSVRIDVHVRITDTSTGIPPEGGARD